MSHHSTNSSGYFLDTGIDHGHHQLSIIDSEYENKPMYNEDGYLQIVYCGDVTILDCAMIWN